MRGVGRLGGVMGKQLSFVLAEGEDPARIAWWRAKLEEMALFWPRDDGGKRPRIEPRQVEKDRWELEIATGRTGPLEMPPLRAAGRTRSECIRAAVVVGAEILRTWAASRRRLAEQCIDLAAECERWCEQHTRQVEVDDATPRSGGA